MSLKACSAKLMVTQQVLRDGHAHALVLKHRQVPELIQQPSFDVDQHLSYPRRDHRSAEPLIGAAGVLLRLHLKTLALVEAEGVFLRLRFKVLPARSLHGPYCTTLATRTNLFQNSPGSYFRSCRVRSVPDLRPPLAIARGWLLFPRCRRSPVSIPVFHLKASRSRRPLPCAVFCEQRFLCYVHFYGFYGAGPSKRI